ncbi:serine hydrolase domain-containing protein [Ekhidna sp.]|uniref:serine hydrolase domain-containing protein n=1 Tax=Ekhidna sp. TaxID=2608089 RepID=UPI003B5AD0BE
MAHYKVPGVTIAVIKDYALDWADAYGVLNQKTEEKVTPSTAFQAASISKTINAIGVLKWALENNIDIKTDVNKYLKSWKLESEDTVTIYDLLTHTAGLSVHGFPGYTDDSDLPGTVQILNGQKPANNNRIEPLFAPREKFKYSGGGTTIIQLLLEDNAGDYAAYMSKAIFTTLEMERSFYPTNFKDLVSMSHDHKGKTRKNGYNVYPELGAAALWTTPTDLAKLIIELQLSLEGKSEKILTQQTVQLLTTPWMEGQTNALGTFIDSEGEIKYFQHSGGNEGFNCLYYASMEKGHGAVVMINAEKFDLIHEIMRGIAETYGWSTYLPTIVERADAPTKDELKSYEGTYRSVDAKDKTVEVFLKKGNLFVEQKKRWRSELMPQGNNVFITKTIQPAATVTFEDDKIIIKQGEEYVWIKE